MPRVTFTKEFTWVNPNGRGMITFPAGYSGLVTTEQAKRAVAAGAIKETKRAK